MEKNDKGFEDFLREKLNADQDTPSAWDKPDPTVWHEASIKLLRRSSATKVISIKSLAIGLLTGAIIVALVQFKLSSQRYQAKLQEQENQVLQAQSQVKELEAKLRSFQGHNRHKENKPTDLANSPTPESKSIVTEARTGGHSTNSSFTSYPNQAPGMGALAERNAATSEQFTEKPYPWPRHSFSFLPLSPPRLGMPESTLPAMDGLDNNVDHKVKPLKNWEIGYALGFQQENWPTHGQLGQLESAFSKVTVVETVAPSHGLYLAYAVQPNFYVRTGVSHTAISRSRHWEFVAPYPKSNEYLTDMGLKGNDLDFEFHCLNQEQAGDIQLLIPADMDLQNEELLSISLKDQLEFQRFQVPLSLVYFGGKGAIQWQVQAGGQWTHQRVNYDLVKTTASVNDKPLLAGKITLKGNQRNSTSYWSTFAGMGLNYRLFPAWHLRLDMIYQYHFIRTKADKFSSKNLLTRNINLGLNYRF